MISDLNLFKAPFTSSNMRCKVVVDHTSLQEVQQGFHQRRPLLVAYGSSVGVGRVQLLFAHVHFVDEPVHDHLHPRVGVEIDGIDPLKIDYFNELFL